MGWTVLVDDFDDLQLMAKGGGPLSIAFSHKNSFFYPIRVGNGRFNRRRCSLWHYPGNIGLFTVRALTPTMTFTLTRYYRGNSRGSNKLRPSFRRTQLRDPSAKRVGMVSDKEPRPKPLATESVSSCRHHWIIEPATGPISEGKCQNCGEVREFNNSIDYEKDWPVRNEKARSRARAPREAGS